MMTSSIKVTDQVHERVDRLARATGRTRGGVIEAAVGALERWEAFCERMRTRMERDLTSEDVARIVERYGIESLTKVAAATEIAG